MPHASQLSQVSTWKKLGEIAPVREHRQCLLSLANCPKGICEFWTGCIGSLSKTHTGVTAHLWTASGCPASENGIGNKKLPQFTAGIRCP